MTKRIFGLDLVRTVAVLLVLIGHYLQHAHLPDAVVHFGRLGILGVEIFFVLSGYLIGGILLHEVRAGGFAQVRGLLTFWRRRWLRTLPLYYLFFFLYLRFDWTGAQTLSERWDFLLFLQNFAWPAPDFFLLAWSLAIEEYFYLLFPLFLWLLLKVVGDAKRGLGFSILVFLTVPLVLRAWHVPYPDWDGFNFHVRMMTIKRLDALMYGVGAVFVREYLPATWLTIRRATPLSAAFFLGVCLYIYADNLALWGHPLSGLLQVIYFPLVSLAVALLLPAMSAWRQVSPSLPARAVVYVSTISYSLYLGHILVITGVRNYLSPERLNQLDGGVWQLFTIYTVLIFAFATLTYYGWERVFLRLRDRRSGRA